LRTFYTVTFTVTKVTKGGIAGKRQRIEPTQADHGSSKSGSATNRSARASTVAARKPGTTVYGNEVHAQNKQATAQQEVNAVEKEMPPDAQGAARDSPSGTRARSSAANSSSTPRGGRTAEQHAATPLPIDADEMHDEMQREHTSARCEVPGVNLPQKRARPPAGFYNQDAPKKAATGPRKKRAPVNKTATMIVHMDRNGTPGGPLRYLIRIGPQMVDRIVGREGNKRRGAQHAVYDDMG